MRDDDGTGAVHRWQAEGTPPVRFTPQPSLSIETESWLESTRAFVACQACGRTEVRPYGILDRSRVVVVGLIGPEHPDRES
jgi:hypothetical protein